LRFGALCTNISFVYLLAFAKVRHFFFSLLENLNETKDLTLKMLTLCGYIRANCTVLLIYGKLHNQATNPV